MNIIQKPMYGHVMHWHTFPFTACLFKTCYCRSTVGRHSIFTFGSSRVFFTVWSLHDSDAVSKLLSQVMKRREQHGWTALVTFAASWPRCTSITPLTVVKRVCLYICTLLLIRANKGHSGLPKEAEQCQVASETLTSRDWMTFPLIALQRAGKST